MNNENVLTVEIKNEKPILLVDFTNSFLSLADEYERFIRINDPVAASQEAKLFIREIRPGSIIADLYPLVPLALIAMENANTILDFANYLKKTFDYFLGRNIIQPDLKKKSLENFAAIVEPVAKDKGSQFNVINNGNLYVNIPFQEANVAQNAIGKALRALKEPSTGLHEKVLMYFFQARGDPSSQVGDRVKIESISQDPKRVIFKDEEMKRRLLFGNDNLFTHAYIVDVAVETIDGKPMVYKVQNIYDSIERIDLNSKSFAFVEKDLKKLPPKS